MAAYLVRRVGWIVVLLLAVCLLVFLVFSVLPGADPAALRAGRNATPEQLAAIRAQLGLDDPLLVRYARSVRDLALHLDFGRSYANDEPVRDLILDRLPVTALLVAGAVALWLAVGVAVGTLSAVLRGRWVDRLAMGLALLAVSAPVYWLGLVALFLFSEDLGRFPLLPGAGAYDAATSLGGRLAALVMPWCVLAASFAAVYARLLRGSLLDVLEEDYVRTARAKGLSERRVVVRHGVRAAGTPLVTVLGVDVGVLLGGALLTETVFNLPGVGRLAFDAVERADLATIQGCVLFAALAVALATLLVDLAYAGLDPRVRRR